MNDQEITSQDERVPVAPWTEIPFIPLPTRDPSHGGKFFSDAREINIGDGGDNVFRVDRQGMWLGAALYENAPFRVSMLGSVIAESLEILGGTITGATIQTSALAATGIKLDTTSFRGYNSAGDNTFLISTTTGDFQLRGYSSHSLTRIINMTAGGAQTAIAIEDRGTTDPGFKWEGPTAGSSSVARQDVPAFYFYNHDMDHGDGFTARNTDTDWDGKFFHVMPTSTKNTPAFYIDANGYTGIYPSQITSDGLLCFPAFHHYSEFEEAPAALASSVIAKSFWVGGGTSGTQVIAAEGADGLDIDVTYIRLSTTATASRSSSLTHVRSVNLPLVSRWEALISHSTGRTTTTQKWGWYADASHYAYFLFDTAQHATKIYFAYNNGSGETLVDLGWAMQVADYFWKYTIQCYSGKIYVFVEDALKATISTTVPSYGKAYFYVDNKSTAVERIMDIDYVKTWFGRSNNF